VKQKCFASKKFYFIGTRVSNGTGQCKGTKGQQDVPSCGNPNWNSDIFYFSATRN
jgi:hypothetical protein